MKVWLCHEVDGVILLFINKLLTSFFGISEVKAEPHKAVRLAGAMFIIFLMGKKLNISSEDSDMIIFNDSAGSESS